MVLFAVPLRVYLNVWGGGVFWGSLDFLWSCFGVSFGVSLVIHFLFVPGGVLRQNCSDKIELILEFFLTISLIRLTFFPESMRVH